MSAMQQPTPNQQSETFGSGQTQFFECEALAADHPEMQARERVRQQRLQIPSETSMTLVTSRNYVLPDNPDAFSNGLWFNLWTKKLWPYNELEPGDTLYWYESPS